MELKLGTAPMGDDEVLLAFEASQLDPGKFRHADHIRMARLCVQRYGASEAEVKLLGGIRRFAERAGVPQKFMHTTTIAWTRLVAAACSSGSQADNFSEWIETHPELLDRNLLAKYYSPGRLETAEARSGWVEPDLAPLGLQDS
jgi:hypothetical protein